jgi:thiosulfate dehydrogenase (quinone) large subunit
MKEKEMATVARKEVVQVPDIEYVVQPPAKGAYAFAVARIMLGLVFLWAFVDKLFGLGFSTEREAAWINGGSPTFGFLSFGTEGPLAAFYQGIAGAWWADWLFMIGLLGIGLAVALGIGLRAAAVTGTLLLVMMWSAALPPANHPFLTYHLIYVAMLIGFALAGTGRVFGLGARWEKTALVRRYPILT